jgi:predicted MFS family arabinose efflux permease
MPIIGPVIGGYLTNQFGWHSVFIGMALASSISLIIIIVFLDESLPKKDKNALRPKILMDSFKEIISDYNFLTFLLIGIGTYIGLFGVLAGITTVLTGSLQQNAEMVGYYISTVMLGHFVFAVLAGAIIQYLGINRIIFIGTLTSLFGATILGWWALNGTTTIYTVLIPTTIYLMGFALTLPAMSAGAMSNFQHMSGRASSLLGFIHQVAGALTAIIIGFVVDGTQIPMAIALFIGSLFAFLIYIIRISKVRFED